MGYFLILIIVALASLLGYFVALAEKSEYIVLYTMISVDDQLILKLESLARLELSPGERISLRKDLESILEMIEKLEEVDTEGIEPLLHIVEQKQELREDQVEGQLSGEEAIKNAPLKEPPYFKVPKVIDRS